MKPETQAWIDKAEGDRKVARREIQTAAGQACVAFEKVGRILRFPAPLCLIFTHAILPKAERGRGRFSKEE